MIRFDITDAGRATRWSYDDTLGFLPSFISHDDPRPVAKQIDDNYQHGGGWRPLTGWKFNPEDQSITYPGDETLYPLATAQVHDEKLYFYHHQWLAIVQPDGSAEVNRMD